MCWVDQIRSLNQRVVILFLQSAPQSILESHELFGMTLEYRRECGKDSVLQSLTSVSDAGSLAQSGRIECQHLLRLEDGAEIVRGRTKWRPKAVNNFDTVNHVPAEST